ncbi:MAG: cytochrome c-type biogenesis protein [Hyphomicrobiaceae bacterium]
MRATALAGCLMLALALMPGVARAVEPAEILPDAGMEQRARALSAELRCLVCQNQSIDDSNAPLAKDLRVLVRERLVAGDTDRQVLDFVVARYGEFVLLRPPVGWHTLLLWLTPLLVLCAAAGWIVLRVRAGRDAVPEAALSPDERRRLQALLAEPDDAAPR